MNLRQVQRDARLGFVREIKKLFLHRRVVEIRPAGDADFLADARAGPGIQFIKLRQSIFRKQTEDGLAAEAAKVFFRQRQRIIGTRLAAVKAVQRHGRGRRFHDDR